MCRRYVHDAWLAPFRDAHRTRTVGALDCSCTVRVRHTPMTLLPVNLPTVKIRTIILRAVSPSKGDKGQERYRQLMPFVMMILVWEDTTAQFCKMAR